MRGCITTRKGCTNRNNKAREKRRREKKRKEIRRTRKGIDQNSRL